MAAESIVQVIINARDNATATLNSVGKGFNNLGHQAAKGVEATATQLKKFQGVSLAATGALVGLGAIVKGSIAEYKESQEVTTKLTQLILNQKGATMEHVNALKNQATAMQQVTTFSDELVMTAQAQLATFDITTESIQKIIPGFLDMVAAEKGATVSMEEMKAAAQGMGKALVGQTDTLTKQGFIFSDLQKKILETGTEQEKLTVITEVMGKTYGGMAKALLDNQGAAGQLQKSLSELKEELGKTLAPVLEIIVKQLTPLLEKVSEWIQKNPELTTKILIVTAAVLGLLAILAPLGFAITGVGIAIAALASPIGIIVLALIALGTIFILKKDQIIAGLQELKEQFNAAKNSIMDNFINPLKSGIEAVREGFSRIKGFVAGGGEGRQHGGLVEAGRPVLVGERQPEVFVPHQNGRIEPSAAGFGGGGPNISLNVNVGMYAGTEMEKRNIAKALYNQLLRLAQSQNKTVAELMGG